MQIIRIENWLLTYFRINFKLIFLFKNIMEVYSDWDNFKIQIRSPDPTPNFKILLLLGAGQINIIT